MTTSGLMHITLLLPVTQYITVYYALMISYLYQTDAVLQELMILVSHSYLMLSSGYKALSHHLFLRSFEHWRMSGLSTLQPPNRHLYHRCSTNGSFDHIFP